MITIDDYLSWDGTAMADLVRRGEITAAELDDACRRVAELADPAVRAVAEWADPAPPTGDGPATLESTGALVGVPTMVKELLGAPGLRQTFGSRLLAEYRPTEVSPYVTALQASGLRIVASTTSSEFGLLGSTESLLHGPTVNPWRAGWSAAGSSGGAAAAVAAGIVPIAHASDGGGSIRVPAAVTGLFGFKPSNGRCLPSGPDAGGLTTFVVDHVVTRSVRDSVAVLAATERTGADAVHPPIGYVDGPSTRRLRIGLQLRTLLGRDPDPVIANAVHETAELLRASGHEVVELTSPLPDGRALSDAFFAAAADTVLGVADMFTPMLGRPPGPDELEPFTLELIEHARRRGPGAVDVTAATRAAAAVMDVIFHEVDVVLSPTLTTPPWPLGRFSPTLGSAELIRRTEETVGYTPVHNMVGCPAMSVPWSVVDGLPTASHLAARPGDDATLLHLAFELEQTAPWEHRLPCRDAERAWWR